MWKGYLDVSCCFLPLFFTKVLHAWCAGGWWHKVSSITCTTRCHTCLWMKFLHLHSALVIPWSVWPSLSLQSSFSTHKLGQSMLSVLPLQFLELSYILRWVYCFCVETINNLEMSSSSDPIQREELVCLRTGSCIIWRVKFLCASEIMPQRY